jgi:iron complex transport system ATP-binding protein
MPTPPPPPALELADVSIGDRLAGMNLNLAAGTVVGLVGPNGSGKSTLLQVAAGLLVSAPGGRVSWNGRDLTGIAIVERGRLGAWVPQEADFAFGFSVRSVVAQGRYAHGDDDAGVVEALQKLDLVALADRPVNRLSGGERERVMLARAVATGAPLQLWDEPLAALDVRHALEVLVLAHRLARAGATVVLSLHDLRVAECLDAVVVLHAGRLRASGPPADVLTPELLAAVFGVRARTAPGLVLELPE